jgi:hypothetical protein
MKYILILLFLNCATSPVSGILFTNTDYAGEMNKDSYIPASVKAIGCQYSLFGLVSVGNSGAGQIAYNKGIKRISSIDHSSLSILSFIYQRNCTIITGATY